MIVKVQLSLDSPRRVLVYNQDRSILFEDDSNPEFIEMLRGQSKVFMHACIGDDGFLDLWPDELLPDQGW